MEIEKTLLTLGYVGRLGKVIDARPPPGQKVKDEVKAPENHRFHRYYVCSLIPIFLHRSRLLSLSIPTSRRAVQIPFSAYQRVGRGAIIVLLEYEVRHAGG